MNRSIKIRNSVRPGAAVGFTLLEVVFAIMIAGIILTGVYQTAITTLGLSKKVVDRQQDEMHLHSLLGVLRRNIEDIPGNAKISMEPPEGLGGTLRSEIVLEDYPLAFSWAGVAAGSKRVLIVSDKDPRGGSRIRIQYLSEEEAEAHADGQQVDESGGMGMTLMDSLKSVSWRFYNQRTEEWEEDWVRPNERPSLVELNIEFYDDSDPLRSVFWIPVVVNPETVVRGQTQRQGGSGVQRAPGGQQPGGGGPGAGAPGGGQRPTGGGRGGGGGRQTAPPGGGRPGR